MTESEVALRVYQDMVAIVGFFGNSLVCFVIFKVRAMRTRTNAFIFHQAVIDFIGCTAILLKSEIPLPDSVPSDALGWFICNAWNSNCLLFFLYTLSTFNLLAMTVEQYFAIVHPFKYQAVFTDWPRLKVGVVMAVCWLFPFSLEFIRSFLFYKEENGRCVVIPISGSTTIGVVTVFLQYVLPVAVMLFAYIRIGVEMKRGAARVGPAPAQHLPNRANAPDMAESLLKARRKTFKLLVVVFVTFVICWTPNETIFLLFNLGMDIDLTEWFYSLSVAMVATNSCVNPIIYAFKYRQFRNGVRQIFCSRAGQAIDVSA